MKQRVRLNENDLHKIVEKAVRRLMEASYDNEGNFNPEAHNQDLRDDFTETLRELNVNLSRAAEHLSHIATSSTDQRIAERANKVCTAIGNFSKEIRTITNLTYANRWDTDN